jgi:hypothetical protein
MYTSKNTYSFILDNDRIYFVLLLLFVFFYYWKKHIVIFGLHILCTYIILRFVCFWILAFRINFLLLFFLIPSSVIRVSNFCVYFFSYLKEFINIHESNEDIGYYELSDFLNVAFERTNFFILESFSD